MHATQSVAQMFAVRNEKGEEVQLVMQDLSLAGHVLPVGARVVVRHVFRSAESHPVEAVYAFGLPRDAALRQFRIEGENFSVRSDLREVDQAVKLYEQGIQEGRLSALARQYGDGLVNLSIGNLRPEEEVSVFLEVMAGVEARDDGYRFRFPFCLAPSYHSESRAAEVEPGVGELELPEDRFGDLLLPRFKRSSENLHRVSFDITLHQPGSHGEVSSPSHTVRVRPDGQDLVRVSLARESDVPNRDLVVDVKHTVEKPIVFTGLDNRDRGQLAVLIPSTCFGPVSQDPARVVIVLDRSGSMQGVPFRQAKKAVEACLSALSPSDKFGIVVFDHEVEKFKRKLAPADRKNRNRARQFLTTQEARGGTELRQALLKAGALFDEPGGDLLVVTDGQVFETESILKAAREMGHRLHVLGIGSASQDRFLSLLARETGGISRFLTARERVDLGALELFASIGNPVAEELTVESSGARKVELQPEPASAVFAGSPVDLWGETKGHGKGKIELSWEKPEPGAMTIEYKVSDVKAPLAETLRLLRGARLLTDADNNLVPATGPAGRRQMKRIEERLLGLSEEFQLASRQMALVAVVEQEGERAGTLPKTHVVPVGIPEDVEFDSYFGMLGGGDLLTMIRSAPAAEINKSVNFLACAMASEPTAPKTGQIRRFLASKRSLDEELVESSFEDTNPLVELATLIESDGGMPGDSLGERVKQTLLALLCFSAEETINRSGIFKKHSQRLLSFIQGLELDQIPQKLRDLCSESLGLLEQPDLDWENWSEVAEKLASGDQLSDAELEQLLHSVLAETSSHSKS